MAAPTRPFKATQNCGLANITMMFESNDSLPCPGVSCKDYICCRTYHPDLHALYAHFERQHPEDMGKISSTMFETGLEDLSMPEGHNRLVSTSIPSSSSLLSSSDIGYIAAGGAATLSSDSFADMILAEELSAALDIDNIDVLTAVEQAIGEYGPGISVKAATHPLYMQPPEAGPSRPSRSNRSRKTSRRVPKVSFQLPIDPSSCSAHLSSSRKSTKTTTTTPTPATISSTTQPRTHQEWSVPLDPHAAASIRAAHKSRTADTGVLRPPAGTRAQKVPSSGTFSMDVKAAPTALITSGMNEQPPTSTHRVSTPMEVAPTSHTTPNPQPLTPTSMDETTSILPRVDAPPVPPCNSELGLEQGEPSSGKVSKGKKRQRDDEESPASEVRSAKGKPYQCTYCNKRYRNPNGLKYHLTAAKQSPECAAAHIRELQRPAGPSYSGASSSTSQAESSTAPAVNPAFLLPPFVWLISNPQVQLAPRPPSPPPGSGN